MLRKNNARTPEYLAKYEKAKKLVLEEEWSLTKASKEVGIGRDALSRCLKEEGYEVVNRQNEVKFNEKIFDKIDTEEKAYWLGFLYADGAIGKEQNTIELSLKSSDVEHLEKFRKFLGFDNNKHIFQDDVRCRISFRNKHTKEALIALGCTPQKSLTLTFPTKEQVPEYLIPHFVRGYVDGDGSVMINTRKTCGRLGILGTEDVLVNIRKKMGWRENALSKKNGGTQVLQAEWSGYYVTEYLDQLYKNANIYLDRKYDKYLEIKALTNCRASE